MTAQVIVNKLLEDGGTFVSAVLTDASRARLLAAVPPVHPTVYAHHMTMAFDPDEATLAKYRPLEGQTVRLTVIAVAVDAQGQAVLVGGDSENEHPHVTISCAEGVPAKYSNELLAQGERQHVNPFTVEAYVTIEPLESKSK